MAKLTDARVTTLQGHFDVGDQPTSAQFDQLVQYIQEGIEEHKHDDTGDGDGTGTLNGPIGIGTAAAVAPLKVQAEPGSLGIQLIGRGDDHGFFQFFENDEVTLEGQVYGTTGKLVLSGPGGGVDLQIIAGGKVGVGMTPTSAFGVAGLSAYANNAAAVGAGHAVGAFYRTGGDPDIVCVVH